MDVSPAQLAAIERNIELLQDTGYIPDWVRFTTPSSDFKLAVEWIASDGVLNRVKVRRLEE
jgi:hypothetical protein